MARRGDSFIIALEETHLGWGTHRYTNTRDRVYGEGYLKVKATDARRIGIYNSNKNNGEDILGVNIFKCNSSDGFLKNVLLKASGCKEAGDEYAKNLHGLGDLKLLGRWFTYINAQVGDQIRVIWTSPNDIILERI